MKKHFKKFSFMVILNFIIVLGCCTTVFATDDFEIGTNNYNNTEENSAIIGVKLEHPEKGWKRFDDTNSKIYYSSGWTRASSEQIDSYLLSNSYKSPTTATDNIKFSFYGSKIRIINFSFNAYAQGQKILIDGVEHTFNENIADFQGRTLSFQQLGLDKGIHNVTIICPNASGYTGLDAVDIDGDGYLIDPSQPPTEPDNTKVLLIINLTDGETKVFDVSSSEVDKFKEWYNTKTEYENKLTYEFNKTVNSNISVEEDIVHNQITSYEIRKY